MKRKFHKAIVLGISSLFFSSSLFAQDIMKDGKKFYEMNCAACHQPTGTGVPGVYPPLAGTKIVNGGSKRVVAIILNGLQGPFKVDGTQYNGVMQPWKAILSDDRIAAVATYIRQSWGNKGTPVTVEQVKAAREEYKGRTAPLSEADVNAIPDEDIKP
ncbi:cytochrome C [Methylacidiphilum sp. Yel]|jgi:mono/diheme cytochrome c family protein|uniref:c-type cytochrome n=1 Tax=Methylacidiphilum sp. Yel TaxID=1847730 RepID=UPI00106D184D|nr:cytochrome c [Methylacidiphilum sp. Yel]TFE66314.1 cytochrome C [Methylacidiphilum sp. Yel]